MNNLIIKIKISIIILPCLFETLPSLSQNMNVYVDAYRRQVEIQRGLDAIKDQRNSKTQSYGPATFSADEKAALESIFFPKKYVPPSKPAYEIAALNKAERITQNIVALHKNSHFGYNNLLDELPLTFAAIKLIANATTNGGETFENKDIRIDATFRNGILEGRATIVYKNHFKISSINTDYVNGEINGKATIIYKDNYYENLIFVNGVAYGACSIYDKNGNQKLSFNRLNNLVTGLVTEFYGGNNYAEFLYDDNKLITLLKALRDDLQYYYPTVEMWRGLNAGNPIYDGFLTKKFRNEGGNFTSDIDNDNHETTYLTGYNDGAINIRTHNSIKRTGIGKMISANGNTRIKYFEKSKEDDFGQFYYNSGEFYEGNFKDNKFNGKGKMYFNDGLVYEGDFKENLRHGDGKFTKKNGFYAKGTFEKGNYKKVKFYNNQNIEITEDVYKGKIENGFAKIVYNEKSFYVGEFKNWQRSGKGYLRNENGSIYEGDFLEDNFNGDGTLSFINGTGYKGQFKNGLYEGKGDISYNNGCKYVGDFSNGNLNGKGTYTYTDKSVLVGDFVNNKATGFGKLIWANGDYYIGGFKDFKLNGKGKIYYPDGTLHFDGSYEDGIRRGPATVYFKGSKETATGVYGGYYDGNGLWEGDVVFTKVTGYKKIARWYGQKWNDIKCFDPKGNPITEIEYNKN